MAFLNKIQISPQKCKNPNNWRKKTQNTKPHSLKARQGHIKHVCKISGSNSQKRRGHWPLKEFWGLWFEPAWTCYRKNKRADKLEYLICCDLVQDWLVSVHPYLHRALFYIFFYYDRQYLSTPLGGTFAFFAASAYPGLRTAAGERQPAAAKPPV